jgi:hypothetical protein
MRKIPKRENSLRIGIVAVTDLAMWFRSLRNWFVGGIWKSLEM